MYSIHTAFAELFAVTWIFVLGSAIGSFLNVVVYRLPRGKTLLGGSFCPRCKQEIQFRDNIPIFGWLMLKGKCRVCRLPISSRYPIVEFICGATLLAIAIPMLALGGINMPGVEPPRYLGFSWNLMDLPANFLTLYATQAFVACCLLTAMLIEWDRDWIPANLTMAVVIAAIITTFINPRLAQEELHDLANLATSLNWHDLVLRTIGGLVGGFAGSLAGWADPVTRRRYVTPWTATIWWAVVGWCLGGFAMLSLFSISAILIVGFRPHHRPHPPTPSRVVAGPFGLLFVAYVLQVVFWNLFAMLPGWPWTVSDFPATWCWLAGSIIVFAITLIGVRSRSPVRTIARGDV